jgi:hypothetical protein
MIAIDWMAAIQTHVFIRLVGLQPPIPRLTIFPRTNPGQIEQSDVKHILPSVRMVE